MLSLPQALRFLLARNPAALTQVLGVVYRAISGYLLKSARLTRSTGHTGALTLIQRLGSAALNLNIHSHILFLEGAYLLDDPDRVVFRHVPEQTYVDNVMYAKAADYKRATQSVWFGGASASAVVLPVVP